MLRISESVEYFAFWPIIAIVVLAMMTMTRVQELLSIGRPLKKPTPKESQLDEEEVEINATYKALLRKITWATGIIDNLPLISGRTQLALRDSLLDTLPKTYTDPGMIHKLTVFSDGMGSPMAMISTMGPQVMGLALNMVLGNAMTFLFPGMVVAKVPFPMTYKFKPMLQRGLSIPDLDPQYISSMSWYFLVYMGCGPAIRLFFFMFGRTQVVIPTMMGMGSPTSGPRGMFGAEGLGGLQRDLGVELETVRETLSDSKMRRNDGFFSRELIDKWSS